MASFRVGRDPLGAAAELAGRILVERDARQGRARLAVSGGSTLGLAGRLRRSLPAGVWGRLALTWADERCVAAADLQSNRGAAYREGHLDPRDPPGLELPLYLDGEDPGQAALRVCARLCADFQDGLDLVLLGLGEDGHVASLFPGQPFRAPDGAAAFAVLDSPKPPPCRITLALPVLAGAAAAILVAAGEGKRAALARLAQGDPALPASALGSLTVFTDLAGLPG